MILRRLDRRRLGAGGDQHRALIEKWRRPGEGVAGDIIAGRQSQRVDPETRPPVGEARDLFKGRRRTTAGQHRRRAGDRLGRRRRVLRGQPPLRAINLGQAHGDARTAGDQRQVLAGRADGHQIRIGDGVDNRHRRPLGAQGVETRAQSIDAGGDIGVAGQTDTMLGLPLKHLDQIAVGHRCQRMAAHMSVGQQLVADEQMSAVEGAAGFWKHRTGDGEIAVQGGQQGVGDRADIAVIGGIEGRAIFEKILPAAGGAQPVEGGQRLAHRLVGRDGA